MMLRLLAAAMALPIVAAAALAAPVPHVSITGLAELPVVERAPYNEAADADKAVDAAFARAKKSGKRVLIDLGGNWCGDCVVLANFMQLPEMKSFMAAHFEIVAVDVGRYDRNLDIPARFGFTKRLDGVPTVIIAEPDGRFINAGNTFALTDARHMTPQSIADWLAQWAK